MQTVKGGKLAGVGQPFVRSPQLQMDVVGHHAGKTMSSSSTGVLHSSYHTQASIGDEPTASELQAILLQLSSSARHTPPPPPETAISFSRN